MKDGILKLRIDTEIQDMLECVQKHYQIQTKSEMVRQLIEREFKKIKKKK